MHARWSRPVTSRRSDAGVVPDAAAKVSSSSTASGRRSSRDRHADAEPAPRGRVFVLDTSVLLSDPAAFRRFTDHEVVVPLVVISELEGKRHHPELGWFARQSLRMLDELRIKHGRLDQPVLCNDEGGTLRVELNHADQSVLPYGFRNDSNDARILSVALGLAAEGRDVTLVSKDMPLRVKAASVGLTADEYRHGQASDPTWTGMADLKLGDDQVNALYAGEELELEEADNLPCHTGLVIHSSRGSALGRVGADKTVRLVRGDREAFGIRGRSAEQRVALDLLLDESIGIVSLGGRAGTGKSALALCAGLEATMERNRHKKVIVFRPLSLVVTRPKLTSAVTSRAAGARPLPASGRLLAPARSELTVSAPAAAPRSVGAKRTCTAQLWLSTSDVSAVQSPLAVPRSSTNPLVAARPSLPEGWAPGFTI